MHTLLLLLDTLICIWMASLCEELSVDRARLRPNTCDCRADRRASWRDTSDTCPTTTSVCTRVPASAQSTSSARCWRRACRPCWRRPSRPSSGTSGTFAGEGKHKNFYYWCANDTQEWRPLKTHKMQSQLITIHTNSSVFFCRSTFDLWGKKEKKSSVQVASSHNKSKIFSFSSRGRKEQQQQQQKKIINQILIVFLCVRDHCPIVGPEFF